LWCEKCNRIFDDEKYEYCPICKDTRLKKIEEVECPNCKTPMQIGYISVPLRIDWRSAWAKGAPPEIIIQDENMKGAWIRKVTYYCSSCQSLFIYKVKNIKKMKKKTQEQVNLTLLCPQCGRERVPNAKYCPFCGLKMESEDKKLFSRFSVNKKYEK